MPLRPDPLKELLDLQERMNRLFEATLSPERPEEMETWAPSWIPLADVLDTPDAYVVEIELPGLGREEIDVHVNGRELVVRGVRDPAGGGSAAFLRLERRYGPFTRAFRFDVDIDADGVEAEIKDGLLSLSVPKSRPRSTRRVITATKS